VVLALHGTTLLNGDRCAQPERRHAKRLHAGTLLRDALHLPVRRSATHRTCRNAAPRRTALAGTPLRDALWDRSEVDALIAVRRRARTTLRAPASAVAAVLAVTVVASAGCTGRPPASEQAAAPTPPAATSTAPTTPGLQTVAPTAAATPPAAKPAKPAKPHPVSLLALMQKRYDGRSLRVGRVLARTSEYTRYSVTYRSGALSISGIMNVPRGNGPFPVLILNHGYIDPRVYTTGRGLAREQDYLARQGYVVLHTDYRNHAQSDDDPNSDFRLRLGYTEDVINAVLAVKKSSLPYLDGDRVGLLGRSMGGGVTLNALVVQPGLVDAAVVYAPVSSNAVDNFNRWIRGTPERRQLAQRIIRAYGSPERNPAFWRNVSPVTFLDRISEPILIHHGTADESCPIQWSHQTVAALQRLGKDATLLTYRGEPHAFGAAWPTSIRRTVAFFDRHLRA
jgi:dienelactone hydrolase